MNFSQIIMKVLVLPPTKELLINYVVCKHVRFDLQDAWLTHRNLATCVRYKTWLITKMDFLWFYHCYGKIVRVHFVTKFCKGDNFNHLCKYVVWREIQNFTSKVQRNFWRKLFSCHNCYIRKKAKKNNA